MGVTGLVAWVVSKSFGKRRALARATARRVIRSRYGGAAIGRFNHALEIAEREELAREQAAYRAACEKLEAELERERTR